MLFFSVQRSPKSITEHPPLCLSYPCPWASIPAQLSLGPLVPVQEMLWRSLSHCLLFMNCFSALLDWRWDLACLLAIARWLSHHHAHLCWPCPDAEPGPPTAAATGVTDVVSVWELLLAPGSPVSAEQHCSCWSPPLWFHTHPALAACTASSQSQQHRNTLVTVWGPQLMTELLLLTLNFLVSEGTTPCPTASPNLFHKSTENLETISYTLCRMHASAPSVEEGCIKST